MIHSDLAAVQNMEKGLPVVSAKGAGVSRLLSPRMENGVSGEWVEGRVQCELGRVIFLPSLSLSLSLSLSPLRKPS